MLLGDILSRFDDETFAAETVMRLGDLNLLARLRMLAETEGQTLGEFAYGAMRHYAANAGDEEWVSLMGALARTDDPAAECLRRALTYATREMAA